MLLKGKGILSLEESNNYMNLGEGGDRQREGENKRLGRGGGEWMERKGDTREGGAARVRTPAREREREREREGRETMHSRSVL